MPVATSPEREIRMAAIVLGFVLVLVGIGLSLKGGYDGVVNLQLLTLSIVLTLAGVGLFLFGPLYYGSETANKTKILADETNELLSKIGKQLVAQTELLERLDAMAMGNEPPPRKPIEEAPTSEEDPTVEPPPLT
jgi:hypothetical protein